MPLPMPAEAKLIDPGFALAVASKSCTDLKLDPGAVTSTLGCCASGPISTKSFSVSNGSLAYSDGLTVCPDECISKV